MTWLLSREPMTLGEIEESARKAGLRGENGGGTPPAVGGAAGGRASGPASHAAPAKSRRGARDRRGRRRRAPKDGTEPEGLPGFHWRRLDL
jgi:hypothetical protein